MTTEALYVIVNMVTAELVTPIVYTDKDTAEANMKSYQNWLGSYTVISLKDHIDALHSHFERSLNLDQL